MDREMRGVLTTPLLSFKSAISLDFPVSWANRCPPLIRPVSITCRQCQPNSPALPFPTAQRETASPSLTLALLPTTVWGRYLHPSPPRPSPLGQQNEAVAGAVHQTHNGVAIVVPVDDELAPTEAAHKPADSNGRQARGVLGKRET